MGIECADTETAERHPCRSAVSPLAVRLTVMLCFTVLSAKTVEFGFLLCVKNVFLTLNC